MHAYTCYGALRPFGSSILISGVDPTTKQHELYMSDPSGTTLVRDFWRASPAVYLCYVSMICHVLMKRYFGCAIGKGVTAARTGSFCVTFYSAGVIPFFR